MLLGDDIGDGERLHAIARRAARGRNSGGILRLTRSLLTSRRHQQRQDAHQNKNDTSLTHDRIPHRPKPGHLKFHGVAIP